ncbi:MAG: hypothetical protein IJW95_03070 [Clostridia bacterium]|nr:hypothetical protein [Clostridia bacterium]
MKKRVWITTIAACLIVSLGLTMVGCDNLRDIFFEDLYQLNTDLEGCEYLFGCTPEEFFTMDFEAYGLPADFSKDCKILENGHLRIQLNEEQMYAWRNSLLLTDYSVYPRIGVSPDNKRVTVYAYDETVNDDVVAVLPIVLTKLSVAQGIDGELYENVEIEVIVQDAVTNEVFFRGIWPDFDHINLTGYTISSLTEN